MKRYSSDLTARQWQRLAPLLLVRRTSKWPLQAVANGIFCVPKNGCVWRDVPADLPPWPTVYYHFTKWTASPSGRLHQVDGGR
ncbi:MAG: transposase [Janthinobacterium lividum]